jgi:hypothetical protein
MPKTAFKIGLSYLEREPRIIYWKVVAGDYRLSDIQRYDLVYDQHDLNIRGIKEIL